MKRFVAAVSFCLLFGGSFLAFRSSSHHETNRLSSINGEVTADHILAKIKDNLTCEWADETVDTYKSGSGDTEVTGIATTFLATYDVIKRAHDADLNMIITHEPTYYNHFDASDFFEDDDVFEMKRTFLEEHNMVVLRFHDHWHRTNPDGIQVGMVNRLGWKAYQSGDHPLVFKLPLQTVSHLAKSLRDQFQTTAISVVGNPDMEVSQVGFSMGAPGSQSQIRMLRRNDVEVLIIGETHQWETVEYVRDAVDQGKRKALILLGHANSEEAGMEYCAEWLKTFIDEVPVQFVEAGDPLWAPE